MREDMRWSCGFHRHNQNDNQSGLSSNRIKKNRSLFVRDGGSLSVFMLSVSAREKLLSYRHMCRNAEIMKKKREKNLCMHLFHPFDVLLEGFEVPHYLMAPRKACKLVGTDKISDWQSSIGRMYLTGSKEPNKTV